MQKCRAIQIVYVFGVLSILVAGFTKSPRVSTESGIAMSASRLAEQSSILTVDNNKELTTYAAVFPTQHVQIAQNTLILLIPVLLIFLYILHTRNRNRLSAIADELENVVFDQTPPGTSQRSPNRPYDLIKFSLERLSDEVVTLRNNAESFNKNTLSLVEDFGSIEKLLADLRGGDLNRRLDGPLSDRLEGIRIELNATADHFENMVKNARRSSDRLYERVSVVRASTGDLSNRTENQAATLEETAAALDELSASVQAAADNAASVETEVKTAREDATISGEIVADAVSAMAGIEKSSDEISKIIGVIDDISFQTNLLALNAGVEAARAGEAGRGFAVVASEVRALAQRSSEAARQIKQLISTSQNQVDTGVKLVGKTGNALSKISERVDRISGLMTVIASGAQEQATSLGEINTGVAQLDKATQQNAGMVQETLSATAAIDEDVSTLIAQLDGSVRSDGRPIALETSVDDRERNNALSVVSDGDTSRVSSPPSHGAPDNETDISERVVPIRPAADLDMSKHDPLPIHASTTTAESEDEKAMWKDF